MRRFWRDFWQNIHRSTRCLYPGLEEDPGFSTASRLLRGGYGGLLAFDVGSEKRAFEVLNKVTLGQRLANIGDAKTLVIHPASTIYSSFPPDLQMVMGVTDGLIRVSVGLEEADDLLADFEQALKKVVTIEGVVTY